MDSQIEWQRLSPEEKKLQLFLNQKKLWICFSKKMQFLKHNMIKVLVT